MRKLPVFILLVLCYSSLLAQVTKDCFDASGKSVEEARSAYCVVGKRVLRVEESQLGLQDTVVSYIDTVRAYYSGATPTVKYIAIYNTGGVLDGHFVEYHENGRVKERGTHKHGKKLGIFSGYYPSGKLHYALQYLPENAGQSKEENTHVRIINYYDSSGTSLVKNGDGFCTCSFFPGKVERGKVTAGLRDSLWSEYSGDTLLLKEDYRNGELMKGVRYDNGGSYEYTAIREYPEYTEGYEGMMEVIRKNMRYPADARRSGVDGTVIISFRVKIDGSIDNLRIRKGIGKGCEEEALRVIRLLKQWTPARYKGKPLDSEFNLPIRFKLS